MHMQPQILLLTVLVLEEGNLSATELMFYEWWFIFKLNK